MERLKNLREDLDLNQKTLAKILHCSQSTYSRYETDICNVSIDLLKELAIFYNTSVDYIIGLTNNKKPYERSKKLDPKS